MSVFNESSDWNKLKEKKREFYKRMETDFDFRMEQVDKKLMTVNAFEPKTRYFRYKTTVHDTMLNIEYEIGIYGQLTKYKGYNKNY